MSIDAKFEMSSNSNARGITVYGSFPATNPIKSP